MTREIEAYFLEMAKLVGSRSTCAVSYTHLDVYKRQIQEAVDHEIKRIAYEIVVSEQSKFYALCYEISKEFGDDKSKLEVIGRIQAAIKVMGIENYV